MTNVIVVGIILIIIGCSTGYIVKEKKKGTRCIGCPAAGNCASCKNGKTTCSSCQTKEQEK